MVQVSDKGRACIAWPEYDRKSATMLASSVSNGSQIEKGQFAAIVGPSGKSNIILTVLSDDSI